jgi:membrane protease YdiL (CAAX protease family)
VTTENLFGDLFSGVVAAPLFEEFAFRGLFLGCLLARGWSPLSAIALTSFVFGLTHVQYYPSGMMMVMVSGAIFGFLRVLTGGLLAPIAAHGALNFLISMIELSFPGEP